MRLREMLLAVLICTGWVGNAIGADQLVSIESLLREMIDRDAVARYPEREFRLKQQSSYNRASKTPDEPKGWFTNKDYNSKPTDKNFIRVDENAGKQEWVLMDHEGPGAIVRTWMPWLKPNKPETTSRIRIYLDDATEPILEGNTLGFLDGTGLIPYPLAHSSLRSAVSFFPIPYAKSCKVTTTERPFFFQFTFREYVEGTQVKTFTMEDFEKAAALTEQVGKALLNTETAHAGQYVGLAEKLAANEEKSVPLPTGSAAVRELSVKLGDYSDPSVTRKVVLKVEFDGKDTVWCPVGDFFGSGIGLHPFQGWYRTVAEDGKMSCRWVMPYQKNGRISVVNLGDEPVDVQLLAVVYKWPWDQRSMYFHAAWRGQYPVPTRPFSDWNYVTLKGRGVYVGDTLTIMNPLERWWGEGDEKIWVDGEAFPSIFGTGTEDYYAYAWGGRSTDFYEHPFHAQVRCNRYDKLNRKTLEGERNTQGFSSETRTRALDTMPFSTSLQLDMEVWSWTECEMGYGVGVYWYGDAGSTSNRQPDPQGAVSIPPLPEAVDLATSVEENVNSLPNVVLIFADDLGYGDLGCYGATKVKTPNIDRLAAQGRRFTDAHSASAVCTPSRYGLLTGEYPVRANNGKGLWGPCSHSQSLLIDLDKLTLGQLFKNKGYATAAVGKWHLGFGTGKTDWNKPLRPGPLELGFDYYFGVPKVNSGFPYVYVENDAIVGYDPNDPLVFGNKPYAITPTFPAEAGRKTPNRFAGAKKAHEIYDDERTATLLVEKSVKWIKENKEKPFFLYLPTTNIHHPFTPASRFKGTSQCGLYGDFIHEFDWMVGEVMNCLEDNGLADNTLVIVTSDNGGMFNTGGQDAFKAGHRQNADLLGFKFGVWEGGHRVPFIAKWPGRIKPNTVSNQLISAVDMLATFAALTGQTVEDAQLSDSINVLPALLGQPIAPLRETLVLCPYRPRNLAIRKGKWVYIPAQGAGGFTKGPGEHAAGGPKCVSFVGSVNSDIENGKIKKEAPPAQLYDLEADVNQTKNLYQEYPDVVRAMEALLKTYQPKKLEE